MRRRPSHLATPSLPSPACGGGKGGGGQGSRLRSCGLLRPRQALFQAELYPVVIGDPWENRTPATASTVRCPAIERKGHGHRRSRISKHHLLKMAALPVCLCAHSAW